MWEAYAASLQATYHSFPCKEKARGGLGCVFFLLWQKKTGVSLRQASASNAHPRCIYMVQVPFLQKNNGYPIGYPLFLVREAGRRHRKRHIIRFPAERENLFILLRRLFSNKTASLMFAGDPVIRQVLADTCV